MALLVLDLEEFRSRLPESNVEARQQVNDICDHVQTLTRDINAISHRLHSSRIGILGLTAAARSFCHEFATRHQLPVEFVHSNVPDRLPDGVGINLFRVLQEALANVTKHSGASKCRVSLDGTSDRLQLNVVDNGRGFDVRVSMATSGLGLISMAERLRMVGGDVAYEAAPGRGTTVRAWVPLRAAAVTNETNHAEVVGL